MANKQTARSYFSLLPKDLILSFVIGLNYPETLELCNQHEEFKKLCYNGDIWKYKISVELGFVESQYLPTASPLHLKYLELKSLKGIDYGSEYFLKQTEFANRASRLYNSEDRRGLVNYYFEKYKLTGSNSVEYSSLVCLGALVRGDTELYGIYFRKLELEYNVVVLDLLFHIGASAEKGDDRQVQEFTRQITNILGDDQRINDAIANGLIRGSHLTKLKKLKTELGDQLDLNDYTYPYQAASFGQEKMLEYTFQQAKDNIKDKFIHINYFFLQAIARNNDFTFVIDFLDNVLFPGLKIDPKVAADRATNSGASSGSLAIIKHYLPELSEQTIQVKLKFFIISAIEYNHVDTVIYLYGKGGRYSPDFNNSHKFLPDTIIILHQHGVLDKENVLKILNQNQHLTEQDKQYIRKTLKFT